MNRVFISYSHNDLDLSDEKYRLREALLACLLYRERARESWIDRETSAYETWVRDRLIFRLRTELERRESREIKCAEFVEKVRESINREQRLILPIIDNSADERSNFASPALDRFLPTENNRHPVAREIQTYLDTEYTKPFKHVFSSQDQPSCPINPPAQFINPRRDKDDDPPDDLNVPPEPATYEIPGLSEQSLQTYLDVMLQETSNADRQQVQHMGKQLKARRRSLGISRNELAEQLDIEIERILLAESGYGEVDTVRDLLEQTQRLQNEIFRLH